MIKQYISLSILVDSLYFVHVKPYIMIIVFILNGFVNYIYCFNNLNLQKDFSTDVMY